MTNKEAIKNIKDLLRWYVKEEPMSETMYKREAVQMAIKALEFDLDKHDEEVIKNTVESIWGEPCEDCVSRSEVENILHNTMFDNATHDKAYRVLGLVRKQVDNLPSVQPKQKEDDA